MASLSKVTDGELTELKRILSDAGFDTGMVRGFNKKPELTKPWVDYGRTLLSSNVSAVARPTARQPKLRKRQDGSYALRTTRLGLTDDHIVADFKAAGWGYINPFIRADRRLLVSGKLEIATGTERMLTIKNVVPSGETWKFQKVMDTIGAPALAFDLEDLRNLVLGHEEELLKRCINWVVAPAARFRSDDGDGCVVFAALENRKLSLSWVEDDCHVIDWFGSSK